MNATTRPPGDQPAITIVALQNAVMMMDACSQTGFERIEAMAKAALLVLERPDRDRYLIGLIDSLLQGIASTASDMMDTINAEAERVGANSVDSKQRMRQFPVSPTVAGATHDC